MWKVFTCYLVDEITKPKSQIESYLCYLLIKHEEDQKLLYNFIALYLQWISNCTWISIFSNSNYVENQKRSICTVYHASHRITSMARKNAKCLWQTSNVKHSFVVWVWLFGLNMSKINLKQKDISIDFMSLNYDLIYGKFSKNNGKDFKELLWNKLIDRLNAVGPPVKDTVLWERVNSLLNCLVCILIQYVFNFLQSWSDFKTAAKSNIQEIRQNLFICTSKWTLGKLCKDVQLQIVWKNGSML